MPPYLALVQSLYSVSKSFLEMSLQRFTPGWMAPSPRRMRTCSTLHTTGVISSRFSLVYTVCSPPTRCFRNRSNACGRQMSSWSSTVNDATLALRNSTIVHSLFCGMFSTGDGVEYTGLPGGSAALGMQPGLPPAASSSDRNRFCCGARDGHGDGAAAAAMVVGGEEEEEEEVVREGVEIGGSATRGESGIRAAGTAMVTDEEGEERSRSSKWRRRGKEEEEKEKGNQACRAATK